MPVLELRKAGIYCPAGDFYVDPWQPVENAVVTHGHSDHARFGMKKYLSTPETAVIMRHRLGPEIAVQTLDYRETLQMGDAKISLHPAGHIFGSAQVRIEVGGEAWVVSGDYKRGEDPTCEPFELVKCNGFITETTFGLPIYRWPEQNEIADQINGWWRSNAEAGKASILMGYALGKAQRLLKMLDPTIGPIAVHGAVAAMNRASESMGMKLPHCQMSVDMPKAEIPGSIIVAPPGAAGSIWMRRFGNASTAFASGWMAIRGIRRRRSVDKGFVLSDHVDWPTLLETVFATGAEEVWTTHGYAETTARYLREQGLNAKAIQTEFVGESAESDEALADSGVEADA